MHETLKTMLPKICNDTKTITIIWSEKGVGKDFRENLFANLKKFHTERKLVPYLKDFAAAMNRPEISKSLKAAAKSSAPNKWKQFLKILVPEYEII